MGWFQAPARSSHGRRPGSDIIQRTTTTPAAFEGTCMRSRAARAPPWAHLATTTPRAAKGAPAAPPTTNRARIRHIRPRARRSGVCGWVAVCARRGLAWLEGQRAHRSRARWACDRDAAAYFRRAPKYSVGGLNSLPRSLGSWDLPSSGGDERRLRPGARVLGSEEIIDDWRRPSPAARWAVTIVAQMTRRNARRRGV